MELEKIRERFNAWWQRELIDRALIQVWTPLKGKEDLCEEYNNGYGIFNPFKNIKNWKEMGFDNDYLISSMKEILSSIYYAGDAFPNFGVNLGPGSLAAHIGCNIEFRKDTIWFGPPILKDYKNVDNISLNEEDLIWKTTQKLTKDALEKSNDDYYVSSADLGMGLDIIASLRGTQKLLFDLIEYPDEVKKLISIISDIFICCYNRLYNIVKNKQRSFLGWIPVYCDGRNYPIQCDFCAMISPEMFEKFVAPDLTKISKELDKSIYHLDGPGAVRHLDMLLDIKEIDAIQWIPGAGTPSAVNWIPMLKKIQAKNKALLVYAEDTNEVERLMEDLDPEGLLISVKADSGEEADYIVNRVKKLTVKGARCV